MCLSVFSNALISLSSEKNSPHQASVTYNTNSTTSSVDVLDSNLITIPANHTFMNGTMHVEPTPELYTMDTTAFGLAANVSWNGTFDDVEVSNSTGELRLSVKEIRGNTTDFESLTLQPEDWFSIGQNHTIWEVVDLANNTLQTAMAHPSQGSDGKYSLSTTSSGNLSSTMYTCIQSPILSTPNMFQNYSFSFDSWTSLLDSDAVWVEFRNTSTWQVVSPQGGYQNITNGLVYAPSTSFSGQSEQWLRHSFLLDDVLVPTSSDFQMRFCIETSAQSGQRGGWFIDNISLDNEGDAEGAWIHGNLSGDYAPNAYGIMYLEADLSGLSGQLEFEFWANWDIEGASSDELSIWYSVDNGSSWQVISPVPGLPGWGFTYQGVTYRMESYGWIPVRYGLPTNLSTHQNASQILFSFQVNTDAVKNFGGSFSENWEGMVIDDVSIWAGRNSQSPVRRVVSNFSSQPSQTIGDPSGWKNTSTSLTNEWQWTNSLGNNGPTTRQFSFENPVVAPAGWSILSNGKTGWEIGVTANTSGYGPGVFSSGSNGAAINLVTRYTNNLYTHLISPEFSVPENASARLQFNSWMCAEANWDGGTVSISTDNGASWWYIPDSIPDFHDQISTVNPYSPHYMLGIIDGSNVQGGSCIQNRPQQFIPKSFELNNVSGQHIRARFSFFSDQYLEYDGWYVDDIDFEVEVFQQNGQWTSTSISPDPHYGYGLLDGWYDIPAGTAISVTLLDHQGQQIPDYVGRTLPLPVLIDAAEYPSIQVQLHFESEDEYLTPTIHSLHLGPQHFVQSTELSQLSGTFSNNGFVSSQQQSMRLNEFSVCPFSRLNLVTHGWNASWADDEMFNSSWWNNQDKNGERQYNFSSTVAKTGLTLRLKFEQGQEFEKAVITPQCVLFPTNISIEFDSISEQLFSWPPSSLPSTLGLASMFFLNGQTQPVASTDETTISPQSNISLSYILPFSTLLNTHNQYGYVHVTTNFSSNSTLSISTTNQIDVLAGRNSFYIPLQQRCPNATTQIYNESTDAQTQTCDIRIESNAQGTLKINRFLHFQQHSTFTLSLTHQILETAKLASYQGGNYETIGIPIAIQSSNAGVRINATTVQLPMFIESVESSTIEQWLPNREVEITTYHARVNPAQSTNDAPDITSIVLSLASSSAIDSSFVVVEVDQIDSTPRFRQHSGLGLAALQPSTISCLMNACEVQWKFKSSWLLNDVDDVHYFLTSTDSNGMYAGPFHSFKNTQSNQIENDLEIVELSITDTLDRSIGDWTDPMWPFHIQPSSAMEVIGKVRFDGTSNIWVGSNEAEITIRLQAVPPINASGGEPEWPENPVDFARTWTGEVDENGRFSIEIQSPSVEDDLPSNTWFKIQAYISRCGPQSQTITTSLDRTQTISEIRFLHDSSPPSFVELDVLDPTGRVPLDGHIWMEGQNIPVRLFIEDDEGLASNIEVRTWFEYRDDDNDDGVMDVDEYQSLWVSVNKGETSAEIDLPLMSWNEILEPTSQVGKASLVVYAYDLAGNPIQFGGSEGEESDAATFEVHRRSETLVQIDDFQFDIAGGHLLPGYLHSFTAVLTEGNGLESLDSIRFHLMSGDNLQSCFIHYLPRYNNLNFDESCFEERPQVEVVQRTPSSTFEVKYSFRLAWQRVANLPEKSYLPSFAVHDEGSSLPIGFSTMERYRWMAERVIDLRIDSIEDETNPAGGMYVDTLTVTTGDVVNATLGVYYNSSILQAEFLPSIGSIKWILSDGVRKRNGHVNLTDAGQYSIPILMETIVMVQDEGTLSFSLEGMDDWNTSSIHLDIIMDEDAPRGELPQGIFENLRSNALDNVELIFIVDDEGGIGIHETLMYVELYRAGKPVEGIHRTFVLGGEATGSTRITFEQYVNLSFSDVEFERGDSFKIWFQVIDNAGYEMTGLGSEDQPYRFGITLVAFEPAFQDILVNPYRAKVGQELSIDIEVVNPGLLAGSTTLLLRNDEGRILNSTDLELESGQTERISWTIEAWKEGRLGLTIELENMTPRIPIPMAAIEPYEKEDTSSGMINAGLSILGIVVIVFLIIIRRNRNVEKWFDDVHFDEPNQISGDHRKANQSEEE